MADINGMAGQAARGLAKLRDKKPLVHHITNNVVMNDSANITSCIGGSPVMTLSPEEAEDMTCLSDSIVLNIGTLTISCVDAMVRAGKKANEHGIPVLLDPVGAGATPMRTAAAERILNEVNVDIVKGNLGEMSVLCGIRAEVRGVDSAGSSTGPAEAVIKFAGKHGGVAVVTGEYDYFSSGEKVFRTENGHFLLSRVVGTGCMLGSVIACFSAVMEDKIAAVCAGLVSFGIAAQLAAERSSGPASFKSALLDEVYHLNEEKIIRLASVMEL